MKFKTLLLSLCFLLFSFNAFAQELIVAVAANLQFTFEEIKEVFEKDSGITIKPIYGSSGKFTAQIENGAPFDLFLSADLEYPQTLFKEGLAKDEPKTYAFGSLVLWTFRDIDLTKGLAVLNDPIIRKIAIASPKTAPYGRQAVNALKHEGMYKDVYHKLVYAESIAQTNQFITSQAADIGITAASIVLAPNMQGKGHWVELNKDSYSPIAQGVVILKQAKDKGSAAQFFDFLFSAKARAIFQKYGYTFEGEHE